MRILAALLLATLVSSCGETPQPPKPAVKAAEPKVEARLPEAPKADPDKELARRVKRVLENEAKIQAAGIDVTAKDGAVTLWGTAASVEELRRAAQAAAKVDGVKSVDNRLQVIRGS